MQRDASFRRPPAHDLFPNEANSDKRYFYAVERLADGFVVARGKSSKLGVEGLILAPDTLYRYWLLHVGTGWSGHADFRTGGSGLNYNIPWVSLNLPLSSDSDGDGLSDEAEFILGTAPGLADTDGDGIPDGTEVAQGTNPIDGLASITGVIGTADTPGNAVDICAVNDIAIIADSDRGVSVFNVFNRMAPLIIAQVRTPGTAQRVACSGNLLAVADGAAGLAIIDVTDPPAASIVHQLGLGATAQAVAASGGIAYVGLADGFIMSVDLATGALLDRVNAGGSVQDLVVAGDVLYALAGGALKTLPIDDLGLRVVGTVGSPRAGGRLFVGGGIAYETHGSGYNTYAVSNAVSPRLIASGSSQSGWGQLVLNGSGLGLATVGARGPDDLSLYDTSDPARTDVFRTTFPTPGLALAVSLYNGLAYVADGSAGLQVVNYLAFDTAGRPPTLSLAVNFALNTPTNGVAEEGKFVRVTANVTDDVQVRNVEFYLDNVKVATDGNFPFEHRFITPRITPQQDSFRLKARASDTGGNFTWTEEIVVRLVPDATPPRVRRTTPPDGTLTNSVDSLFVYFNELLDTNTVNGTNLFVVDAGADFRLGTADDVRLTNGTVTYHDTLNAAVLHFFAPLPFGYYQIVASRFLRDAAGNVLGTNATSTFAILGSGPDGDDDDDKVPNWEELRHGSSPFLADTDGDGWTDRVEIDEGTDPANINSQPRFTVLAQPPIEVCPGVEQFFGGVGAPTYLARPPIEVCPPAVEILSTSFVLARPPIEVCPPAIERLTTSFFLARPPVEVCPPAVERLSTSYFVARPPIEVCPPTVELLGTSTYLARPPVAVTNGVPVQR